MRHILSGCAFAVVFGLLVSAPASAGFASVPGEGPCLKKDNGKGLSKGDDLSKLLAVMGNRCSNSGAGNGSETQDVYTGEFFFSPTGSEALDSLDKDPGNAGAHNKAGKKN